MIDFISYLSSHPLLSSSYKLTNKRTFATVLILQLENFGQIAFVPCFPTNLVALSRAYSGDSACLATVMVHFNERLLDDAPDAGTLD